MTHAEFQAYVEGLMRDGWLFGSAVLHAREVLRGLDAEARRGVVARQEAAAARATALASHQQRVTERVRAHWATKVLR
jgi:hypothetical protein